MSTSMNSKLDADKYKTVGTYPIIYLRYYTRSECINGGWGSDSKFNHYFSYRITSFYARNLLSNLIYETKKKYEISPIYCNHRIDSIWNCLCSARKWFSFCCLGRNSMAIGTKSNLSHWVAKSLDSGSRHMDNHYCYRCSVAHRYRSSLIRIQRTSFYKEWSIKQFHSCQNKK